LRGSFPAEFHENPIRAADEKVPLSVVLVKKKPQYLVFSSLWSINFPNKGTCLWKAAKALMGRGLRLPDLPPSWCRFGFADHSCLKDQVIPRRERGQEAESVQFGSQAVRVVEIQDGFPCPLSLVEVND
jgi:hypothetical protein